MLVDYNTFLEYNGKKLPSIKLQGFEQEKLFIDIVTYKLNNTKAVFIQSLESIEDGFWLEPFMEVTTNIKGVENQLKEDEILVKTWSENESLIEPLLNSGYFEDTGRKIEVSQWCKASIWKLLYL